MDKIMSYVGAVSDSINESLENATGSSEAPSIESALRPIAMMVISLVGVVAAIMIIIGGIQYAMSQGDPGKVKRAKDTILYGVIGLVIALAAFAIVSFVLGAVGG